MSRALSPHRISDQRIEDTWLRPRVRRRLQAAGVRTVGELAERTEPELLTLPNFGQTCLREVRQFLAEHGLTLRPAPAPPCETRHVIAALKDRGCLLTHREASVLELRHGIACRQPLTLKETGDRFELTRERIRQIQQKAEDKVLAHTSMCGRKTEIGFHHS